MSNDPKLVVQDASALDNKVPRNLILMYDQTPYIMKAGLEWKAQRMYKKYSLALEPITTDFEKRQFVFKATFSSGDVVFVNYGEAHAENANSMMQKQLFHLAATRAECRVLRMATACGYASYDEVRTVNGDHAIAAEQKNEDDGKPATQQQIAALKRYKVPVTPDMTRGQARQIIIEKLDAGKEKS